MYELDKRSEEVERNVPMISDWTRTLEKLVSELAKVKTKKVFVERIEDPYYGHVEYEVWGTKELKKYIKEGYMNKFFDYLTEEALEEHIKQEYREDHDIDDDVEVDMYDVYESGDIDYYTEGLPSFSICEYVA